MQPGRIPSANVMEWIRSAIAGKRGLTMTVKSRSGKHFTYRLRPGQRRPRDRVPPIFVDLLTGPNNTEDYTFLAMLFDNPARRGVTVIRAPRVRSPIPADAPAGLGLDWLFWKLGRKEPLEPQAEVWHDGTCARCGRPLTHPESMETGIGPVCARRGAS